MQAEIIINSDKLRKYRDKTFCFLARNRLRNKRDAIDFVNTRGAVFFWPIKGIDFPSLWGGVAGDRNVPNNHDDPAHVTWGWKDELLGKKVWYYAKVLRQKSTIISLDLIPNFYALSPNYGDPEEDYMISYDEGVLSSEEKLVYEALLNNGAMDTLLLRKAANLSSSENTSRFNRALLLFSATFEFCLLVFQKAAPGITLSSSMLSTGIIQTSKTRRMASANLRRARRSLKCFFPFCRSWNEK